MSVTHDKRDKIAAILTPLIGASDGLERANNIIQALAFLECDGGDDEDDPAVIAADFLRAFEFADAPAVMAEIKRVWTG